ncbi:hypothetical protein [Caballeronia sp. DA-9]|uniref:hypothetical protein n=1 Tax=Caballeronia sp. DA-9 TaxID=3436237 RepID=UPI003F665299
MELAKLVGGLILGVGGFVAAVTQYEVGELRAKIAHSDLEQVRKAKKEADTALAGERKDLARVRAEKTEADKLRAAAILDRDQAVQDAAKATAEFRTSLAQVTQDYRAGKAEAQRPLTYLQFKGSIKRELIDELRETLKAASFNAPPAERRSGDYSSQVKYFNAADQADAEKLARSVEGFFRSKGCPMTMPVARAAAAPGQTPPLEVWISGSCS